MKSSVAAIFVTGLFALAGLAANPPAPEAPATGRMRLRFDERSPHNTPENIIQRTRPQLGGGVSAWTVSDEERARLSYDVHDYEFDVIVPPRYKRGVPHGLFIWIGQCDLQNAWLPILAKHKLIASVPEDPRIPVDKKIAHVSKTPPDVRVGLALDAVHNLSKRYDIDERRVYVGGFSAGGALAANLLRGFPEVFSGVCCFISGEFYVCPMDADGKTESTTIVDGASWHCPIEEAKQNAKIVLMRGEIDKMRETVAWGRADAEALRLEGFTRVTYIELPKWPHFPPTAPWFDRAMNALEVKPKKPPTTAPTTSDKPNADQLAQARRLLATAKYYIEFRKQFEPGGRSASPRLAKTYADTPLAPLRQLIEEYPKTPAAGEARELLKKLEAERAPATQPVTE